MSIERVEPPKGWMLEEDDSDRYYSPIGPLLDINDEHTITMDVQVFKDGVDLFIPWTEEGWVVIPVEHYEAVKVFLECL